MDGLLRVIIKRYTVFLIGLFIVSLLVRLLFFYLFLRNNPLLLAFDSGHYHDVALALVRGDGFTNVDGSPHCYRLPGYPLFLASCYAGFTINVTLALLVQIILASLIPLIIFLLSLLVFPQVPILACATAVMSVVHVGFVTFAGLVMSETLFTFFFSLFLIFFLRAMRSGGIGFFAGAGLMLGCASLIRPVGIWIVMVSVLFVILSEFLGSHPSIRFAMQITQGERGAKSPFVVTRRYIALRAKLRVHEIKNRLLRVTARRDVVSRRPYGRRSKFLDICALSGSWLLMIGLWLLRNVLVTGGLFFHTLPGPHFLNHGAARVVMAAQHCSYQQAQQQVYAAYQAQVNRERDIKKRPLYEYECSALAERYALGVMLGHPLQTIALCSVNMIKTVLSLYSSELLCIDSGGQLPPYDAQRSWHHMLMRFLRPAVHNHMIVWIIYAELLMHFFIMAGMLGWLVQVVRRRKKITSVMVYMCCISAVLIGLSCVCGYARLRLPIEPFFIMLAVSFWLNGATGKRVE